MLKLTFFLRYRLQIQFIVFWLEEDYDFVSVYIGPSMNNKFVGTYTYMTKVIIYKPSYLTGHKITIINLSLTTFY